MARLCKVLHVILSSLAFVEQCVNQSSLTAALRKLIGTAADSRRPVRRLCSNLVGGAEMAMNGEKWSTSQSILKLELT